MHDLTRNGDVPHLRYICVMAPSTSFRISAAAKDVLTKRAEVEGTSATALLERLIVEGVRVLDHPGITFRGPDRDRRAALAAGPDVWEVVSRLRELDGSAERRIHDLSEESGLHPRLIRVALDYAGAHPDEIRTRIERNEEMVERSRRAVEQREALLA
jgi:hypothetical protein